MSGLLTGMVPRDRPGRPGRTADDDQPPGVPAAPPPAGDGMVAVYVTVAVRCSVGAGPGVRRVPPTEAAALVRDRHAVYGEVPPRGYSDGGADGLVVAAMMPRPG